MKSKHLVLGTGVLTFGAAIAYMVYKLATQKEVTVHDVQS